MWFKKLKTVSVIVAIMIASFAAGLSFRPVMAFGNESTGFSVLLQIYDLLQSEFVNKNVSDTTLEEGSIVGMLDSLNDPYTRYMNPKAFNEMKEEREGEFSGIGIHIGMKQKQLTVITPVEDTPAARAGLRAGDSIIAIDKKPTRTMALDEAVALIRGKLGTAVNLTIVRAGLDKPFEVSIIRANIQTKAVKANLLKDKIGYIRLSTFMNNEASNEMKVAIKDLTQKGMKSLIIDLRSDPGGLLSNAVDIGSMFIGNGPIVQVVDRNGKKEYLNANGKLEIPNSMKMVVLIDGGSASASEILAGALKDNKRATLIGLKTFGKGLVQTVHPLPNGGAVSITTNRYLTSHGNDIDKKGIDPDIAIDYPKLAPDEDYNEAKDPHILKAIEVLEK